MDPEATVDQAAAQERERERERELGGEREDELLIGGLPLLDWLSLKLCSRNGKEEEMTNAKRKKVPRIHLGLVIFFVEKQPSLLITTASESSDFSTL